jgi:hypothetical protein
MTCATGSASALANPAKNLHPSVTAFPPCSCPVRQGAMPLLRGPPVHPAGTSPAALRAPRLAGRAGRQACRQALSGVILHERQGGIDVLVDRLADPPASPPIPVPTLTTGSCRRFRLRRGTGRLRWPVPPRRERHLPTGVAQHLAEVADAEHFFRSVDHNQHKRNCPAICDCSRGPQEETPGVGVPMKHVGRIKC